MGLTHTLLQVAQLLSALAMVGFILMQHGKGADMGAAFGSGGAGSLFGSSGSANFLSRTTAALATVFFVSTLALAFLAGVRPVQSDSSVLDTPAVIQQTVPANDGPASQIPGVTSAVEPAAKAEEEPSSQGSETGRQETPRQDGAATGASAVPPDTANTAPSAK